MSIRRIGLVISEVVLELFIRKDILGVIILILLVNLLAYFTLSLDLVDGAIAGFEIFGRSTGKTVQTVQKASKEIIYGMSVFVFYVGLLFGTFSMADIIVKMTAPERLVLLLTQPLKRIEVLLGILFAGFSLYTSAILLAVGGFSLIFWLKTGFNPGVVMFSGVWSAIAFFPIICAMLFLSMMTRSVMLVYAGGFGLFSLMSFASSWQHWVGRDGLNSPLKRAIDFLISPIPRVQTLPKLSGVFVFNRNIPWETTLSSISTCFLFGAAVFVLAHLVFSQRDC